MTAYAIAAKANAALLADEAGVPILVKIADALRDRLGIGAGAAGSAANETPRVIEHAYEAHSTRTDY